MRIGLVLIVCLLLTACSPAAKQAPSHTVGLSLQALLEEAANNVQQADYEKAILLYEAMLRMDPDCVDVYMGLAQAHYLLGNHQQAMEILEAGLTAIDDTALATQLAQYAANQAETAPPLEETHVPLPTHTTYCITEGIYTFYSAGSDKVINLSGKTDEATDKNGTKLILWSATGSNMQAFRIVAENGDACRLYAMSSSWGYGRVLQVDNEGDDVPKAGFPINFWEVAGTRDQQWIIEQMKDGTVAIRLAIQPELVVGCGDVYDNGSRMTLQSDVGAITQRWRLVPFER